MNFPLVNMLGEEEGRGTQTEGLITKASVYQTPGKLRSVQALSHVQLFAIPGTAAHQASLSRQLDFTNSRDGNQVLRKDTGATKTSSNTECLYSMS